MGIPKLNLSSHWICLRWFKVLYLSKSESCPFGAFPSRATPTSIAHGKSQWIIQTDDPPGSPDVFTSRWAPGEELNAHGRYQRPPEEFRLEELAEGLLDLQPGHPRGIGRMASSLPSIVKTSVRTRGRNGHFTIPKLWNHMWMTNYLGCLECQAVDSKPDENVMILSFESISYRIHWYSRWGTPAPPKILVSYHQCFPCEFHVIWINLGGS